jgi:hypothetical protein
MYRNARIVSSVSNIFPNVRLPRSGSGALRRYIVTLIPQGAPIEGEAAGSGERRAVGLTGERRFRRERSAGPAVRSSRSITATPDQTMRQRSGVPSQSQRSCIDGSTCDVYHIPTSYTDGQCGFACVSQTYILGLRLY